MWQQYNPNPKGLLVGDCVIRAISKATDKTWIETFVSLCMDSLDMCDMPSANRTWGHYLQTHGFTRHWLPDTCPDCYSVKQFAEDHPEGLYIVALDGHVVCVKDGDWYDTWDSADRVPLYYWTKEDA